MALTFVFSIGRHQQSYIFLFCLRLGYCQTTVVGKQVSIEQRKLFQSSACHFTNTYVVFNKLVLYIAVFDLQISISSNIGFYIFKYRMNQRKGPGFTRSVSCDSTCPLPGGTWTKLIDRLKGKPGLAFGSSKVTGLSPKKARVTLCSDADVKRFHGNLKAVQKKFSGF